MSTPPMNAADGLDGLLARWAGVHRLTDARAAEVHATVLAQLEARGLLTMGSDAEDAADAPASVALDADWFWGLLRPVTSLLDGPNRLNYTLSGLISVGA